MPGGSEAERARVWFPVWNDYDSPPDGPRISSSPRISARRGDDIPGRCERASLECRPDSARSISAPSSVELDGGTEGTLAKSLGGVAVECVAVRSAVADPLHQRLVRPDDVALAVVEELLD